MADNDNAEFVFVYGTLRQEARHPAHEMLARRAELVGLAWLQGQLFELGNYPGAVLSDNPSDRVLGELYLLTDPKATLALLDDYEGSSEAFPEPHEYRRRRIDVQSFGGGTISAWVYLYALPTKDLRRISGGDYYS